MDQWIKETVVRKEQDKLINENERSYQLFHIYDKFFTVTSRGKQKSFQQRQQQLQKYQQIILLNTPRY